MRGGLSRTWNLIKQYLANWKNTTFGSGTYNNTGEITNIGNVEIKGNVALRANTNLTLDSNGALRISPSKTAGIYVTDKFFVYASWTDSSLVVHNDVGQPIAVLVINNNGQSNATIPVGSSASFTMNPNFPFLLLTKAY